MGASAPTHDFCTCRGNRPGTRPCRYCETDPEVIQRAVPCGAELIPAGSWLSTVKGLLPRCYDNRRRNILRVAELIRAAFDKDKGVAMPGVRRIAELLGLGRRTVQRAIKTLKAAKLLVTVARGRSADWTIHGKGDREVYALIRPRKTKLGTPSVSLGGGTVENPLSPGQLARNIIHKVTGRPQPVEEKRLWPKYLAPQSKDSELRATVAFMQLISEGDARIYRRVSPRRLKNILVGLFRDGANIAQLKYMLNHQPDGSPWPHSGAQGVRNPVGWTAARLRPWRGRPIPHVVDQG